MVLFSLETNLASCWEGVRLSQAREVLRTSPEVSRKVLSVELNSNPEVPWKFPRLPRKFPGLSRKFPGLSWRSALYQGSLTPSPDSQNLSLTHITFAGSTHHLMRKLLETSSLEAHTWLANITSRDAQSGCSIGWSRQVMWYFLTLCCFLARHLLAKQERISWWLLPTDSRDSALLLRFYYLFLHFLGTQARLRKQHFISHPEDHAMTFAEIHRRQEGCGFVCAHVIAINSAEVLVDGLPKSGMQKIGLKTLGMLDFDQNDEGSYDLLLIADTKLNKSLQTIIACGVDFHPFMVRKSLFGSSRRIWLAWQGIDRDQRKGWR